MTTGESEGMRYGKTYEPIARNEYHQEQKEKYPDIEIVAGGSNLNTEYPGLSCSHDGWVKINGRVKKVLEIKCPFSLQDVDPHYFDSYLKGKRLNSFYLKRNVKGEITLKENTIYYDQVQMELAMTGVSTCDFVVWSKKGLLTIPISFNQSAWDNLHPKLKKFHWEYMAPEYFSRRSAHDLNPLCLP
ncbi:hypothetical protein FOCC_FOCC004138 [Frankliniella occidentalis]|nr:hypothetical protein FOCC_FOCC004138 [Frankliniella occidentalis]